MKPQKQEKKWPALLVAGGVCAAVLLVLIFRTLNAIFLSSSEGVAPAEENDAKGVKTAAVHVRAATQPNPAAISVFDEHQIELPASQPIPRVESPSQLKRDSAGVVFNTDAQKMREREMARRATIENMRRSALECGDTNAAAELERKLDKIEENGSSFM